MPTIRTGLSEKSTGLLEGFAQALRDEDMSNSTVVGYRRDAGLFLRWFHATEGEGTSIRRVTPEVVAAYRHALIHEQRLKPAGRVSLVALERVV